MTKKEREKFSELVDLKEEIEIWINEKDTLVKLTKEKLGKDDRYDEKSINKKIKHYDIYIEALVENLLERIDSFDLRSNK